MDGVHDMGGMHGFGPLDVQADAMPFHEEWEGRMFAINLALMAATGMPLDAARNDIEQLPPGDYLNQSYFGRWLYALCESLVESGVFTPEQMKLIAQGKAPELPVMQAAEGSSTTAAASGLGLALRGMSPKREISPEAAFEVGEYVRARVMHQPGHTRMPRYVRGRQGVVAADRGGHVFPDTNALGLGENPQRLYSVRFGAQELWGECANASDSVTLDLWESYLEPA